MTAQISDTIHFQYQDYSLAGVSGSGLFRPQYHGLEPRIMSTACYRGFVCFYRVEDECLELQKLWIGTDLKGSIQTKHEHGAMLFDVKPNYEESEYCSSYEN